MTGGAGDATSAEGTVIEVQVENRDDSTGESNADATDRPGRVIAWIIGVALIAVGLFLLGDGSGLLWLVAGVLITPGTRDELYALCKLWVEARTPD